MTVKDIYIKNFRNYADNTFTFDEGVNVIIGDNAQGKTNLSLADVGGEVLVVSQFTLYANCRKGNRPSFTDAADPAIARWLYEYFADLARTDGFTVATGEFGAMMDVALVNHGPFTVVLDTDAL